MRQTRLCPQVVEIECLWKDKAMAAVLLPPSQLMAIKDSLHTMRRVSIALDLVTKRLLRLDHLG